MSTNLSQDRRFMYWGKSATSQTFGVPYPSKGDFETQRLVDSARNANGAVVAQQVGRSNDKQNMEWRAIDPEVWWEMNCWLEDNGMFFYCRYFSYNYGEWRTRQFYVGNIKCTPFKVHAENGTPEVLLDASMNVIDAGW